ncbi:MAG: nitric oxide reductase transcriptional regulator NorR [Planctomycetes bacterium]|nr:nitric oxide reductase transcriptional regulator NorR [Planctomycetota bacterium]
MMTQSLEVLLSVALDISVSMPAEARAQRLVDAVRTALGSDAAALLRLRGDVLEPIAGAGLSADLLGRRFKIAEHVRLQQICAASGPLRFDANSDLPDPFDGHIGAASDPNHRVHACLGCALRVDGLVVGVLTADALDPRAFDDLDDPTLEHVCALAGAALRTIDLVTALQDKTAHEGTASSRRIRGALASSGAVLIGNSSAMRQLREEIDMFARTDLPVLVTGETGVGKELVVGMLHASSRRSDRPLVYMNCAALPESLIESELFGHTKGAFTGAETGRSGKFGVADGASLFLDEVGELPLHVQPKLLRVLQDGELQRVGTDHAERVDVRVLAATNRDLDAAVESGSFRADLLHRLDVGRIRVPALREHAEDIALLAGHFADLCRHRLGCGQVRFDPVALDVLTEQDWPGNVRELENVVSRAVLRGASRALRGEQVLVGVHDLGLSSDPTAAPEATVQETSRASSPTLRDSVTAHQRWRIQRAVADHDGNWSAAARELGLARANLHRLARRLGLK